MQQLLNYFGIGGILLVFLSVFFEITKVKISPLKWLGNALNAGLKEEIKKMEVEQGNSNRALEEKLEMINHKLDDHIIKSYRRDILGFSNELIFDPGCPHTREEWNYIINICKKYEKYIEDNQLENGEVEEATEFIRKKHQSVLDRSEFKDVPKA